MSCRVRYEAIVTSASKQRHAGNVVRSRKRHVYTCIRTWPVCVEPLSSFQSNRFFAGRRAVAEILLNIDIDLVHIIFAGGTRTFRPYLCPSGFCFLRSVCAVVGVSTSPSIRVSAGTLPYRRYVPLAVGIVCLSCAWCGQGDGRVRHLYMREDPQRRPDASNRLRRGV